VTPPIRWYSYGTYKHTRSVFWSNLILN